jgi:oligoribonuclease
MWKYMNDKKMYVWIDLEMTGLNPSRDAILEIATIVTDCTLTILEEGPHFVIHQPQEILDCMDPWVKELHARSGLIEYVRASTTTVSHAQEETLRFIKKHCHEKKALLAGNSVWKDKEFLERYMPRIIEYLFYRIVDVSTIKELVQCWYPTDSRREFKKREQHRALDDIRESIAELQHYRTYFFIHE